MSKKPELNVDDKNFLWLEDFKLPLKFYLNRMSLQFHDKNNMRSARRGTSLVEVHLVQFVEFLLSQKRYHICPVCFQNSRIDVRLEIVDYQLKLISRCRRCTFEWRHDEWN